MGVWGRCGLGVPSVVGCGLTQVEFHALSVARVFYGRKGVRGGSRAWVQSVSGRRMRCIASWGLAQNRQAGPEQDMIVHWSMQSPCKSI